MKTVLRMTSLTLALSCSALAWSEPDRPHASIATLQWNQIAREAIERAKPNQHQAIRLMTVVSAAQYAASAHAPDPKAADAAIAAASAQVIGALMPSQTAFVEGRLRELQPGVGLIRSVAAQRVLGEASTDGFAQSWSGIAPQSATAWRSLATPAAAPAYPAIGAMRTFFLSSGSEARAPQPPALDSRKFLDDLAEVRRYTQAPSAETARLAKFYDMSTGSLVAGYWNERAAALIREAAMSDPQGAAVLATVNAAMMDAVVACHESKYVYWVPRPSQVDPAVKPLIGVPNHPSYPSNHACISTAAAGTLAHFFPQARSDLVAAGAEAGLSRVYAGIHYRFDVDAGAEIGGKVVQAAIARHPQALARWASLGAKPSEPTAQVPLKLAPARGESLAMIVPAKGVQIYECRAAKGLEGKLEWAFVAPEAELFDTRGKAIGRHYGGPHWEALDGSRIVGAVEERTDAPVAGAIPWLLLSTRSVGNAGAFSKVTSIQRVDTVGGIAPAAGCSQATLGTSARVAYTADYYMFSER